MPKILSRLKAAAYGPAPKASKPVSGVSVEKRGKTVRIEFLDSIDTAELRSALDSYLLARPKTKNCERAILGCLAMPFVGLVDN
ncbi:hypothetical protein [Paracoccus actinidiae]|uniref:hypothetical protein n=1 Tax=Paracoccus actinidiae TaxID=3064531 RepID=UPI0027D292C2|nr:hypothetical protein [Paracoccus sp. M09]